MVRSVSTLRSAICSSVATLACVALAVIPGKAQVVGIALVGLFLLVTWRLWTAGIRVEVNSIKVVGLLRSRRVAWNEIDRFTVAPFAGYRYVGHVVLRDGTDIGCLGIAAATRPNGPRHQAQVQHPIDHLNRILASNNPC
jgi:hypothetical protein